MQVLIKSLTVRDLITPSRSTTLSSQAGQSVPLRWPRAAHAGSAAVSAGPAAARTSVTTCSSLPQRPSPGAAAATGASPTVALRTTELPQIQISHSEKFDNPLWLNGPVEPGSQERLAGKPELHPKLCSAPFTFSLYATGRLWTRLSLL